MAAPQTEQQRAKGIDPQLVQAIAGELGETADVAQMLIKRILRTLGEERTRELVRHARVVEEQGGMMVPDGSRHRTLGGVFFKLAKEQATPEERTRIWVPKTRRQKPKGASNGTG
jgi:hypothetical protein